MVARRAAEPRPWEPQVLPRGRTPKKKPGTLVQDGPVQETAMNPRRRPEFDPRDFPGGEPPIYRPQKDPKTEVSGKRRRKAKSLFGRDTAAVFDVLAGGGDVLGAWT